MNGKAPNWGQLPNSINRASPDPPGPEFGGVPTKSVTVTD